MNPSRDRSAGTSAHYSSDPNPVLPVATIPELQQTLTEVTHEINNPLAIISGNAQLLAELARMLDLDPDLAKPIRDIEEASHRLAVTIGRLNTLKETLGTPLSGGDGV